MATTLFRILRYGYQNFIRNGWLSTATVAVITLALMVFSGLIIFNVITDTAMNILKSKIDISVSFKKEVPEDDILRVKRTLEWLSEIKQIDYISQAQALEIFKIRHKDDPTISQALEELGENPLSASLNIKAHDPQKYGAIATYLENESLKQYIEKVSYRQNQIVIDRLATIIDNVNRTGFALSIILALIAGLVAFNTIRIAMYANREEIGIMRLVGAANSFIRGPYVMEGIIHGFLAGVLSLILVYPVIIVTSPYIQAFIPELSLKTYFNANFVSFILYHLVFGIALGAFSSLFAIRKYLKG